MKKLSILGIVIGGISDIVLTNILAIPLLVFILVTRVHYTPAMSSQQLTEALMNALTGDPGLFAAQFLIGSLCSIFAGYLAAWIAKHDELLNGSLSAWLCVASGICSLAIKVDTSPWFLTAISFLLSPALGLLGGYLRLLRVRAKQAKTITVPA
jgi:hypothetical protein